MAGLCIRHLGKSFAGTKVLEDVTLEVPAGALVAVLGASGSGKTTLLRLIAGFEAPDAGEIRIGGELVAGPGLFRRPEARGIGYVAQEGALFPHLNVADNITFGLGRAARRQRHRVGELLTLVGLPESCADRAPQSLSGGQQQRVALARALAPGPKLLLLDEPFSALDAALRAQMREDVAAAIRTAGATAILVTHDQDEALSMAEKVGVLQNGVLAQYDTPNTIYHQPATPALADFIGAAVFLPGFAAAGRARCALGELALVNPGLSGKVRLMLRPEQLKLTASARQGAAAAIIGQVTFYGHDALLRLTLTGDAAAAQAAPLQITARVSGHAIPCEGEMAWLSVEGEVMGYAEAALS